MTTVYGIRNTPTTLKNDLKKIEFTFCECIYDAFHGFSISVDYAYEQASDNRDHEGINKEAENCFRSALNASAEYARDCLIKSNKYS